MQKGHVVAGRYVLESLAARGGMATVWHALDRESGGAVALKVFDESSALDASRFVREAELLADLKHPCIVQYVGHGMADAGRPYLAMEWLEGEELGARVERGPLGVGETVALAERIAAALAYAHARGLVHRDIKPGNVVLRGGRIDQAVLVDFGLARARAWRDTTTGKVLGTPAYMAPEQVRGNVEVGPQADVFSFGALLFESLTFRLPFVGEDLMAVLAKIMMDDAPRVRELAPHVPLDVDDLVARMLAKDPADRPQDGAAVLRALARVSKTNDDAAPTEIGARLSLPDIAIEREQKLVSVVLAAPRREAEAEDPTHDDEMFACAEQSVQSLVPPAGTRVEMLGDGTVIATIAAQPSARDQAAHAAEYALSLAAVLPRWRVVATTGRGVVTERLPIGEAIDRASKLLRVVPAQAGTPPSSRRDVRVDELTAGLLAGRFDLGGDVSGMFVRGKRLLATPVRTLLGREVSCVGRERELSMLAGAWAECTSERAPRALLVTGELGLGKSRLLHEFLRSVIQSGEPVEVWRGVGDPMRAGSPFGLLAQALRRTSGVHDAAPIESRRASLRDRVARRVRPAIVDRVAEFLGDVVGTPFLDDASAPLRNARRDPAAMGDQMMRAWLEFVYAEASVAPVVIVFEDLHWGDLPSVRFADAALHHLSDLPIFVLATALPSVHGLFPGLWAERGVAEVRLQGLSKKASAKLVREALGDRVDDATVAQMVEQAGGSPLYLEELVRAAAGGADASLPATLLAMMQVRLEALPQDARRVLRAAAVFGRSFHASGVAMVLGAPPAEVRRHVEDLVSDEVLVQRAPEASGDDTSLAFRTPSAREAAYAMLTDEGRRVAHERAGAWLESVSDPDSVAIAEHFERGGCPQRASRHWRRGAEDALAGNDLRAAVERAARGRACMDSTGSADAGALDLIEAIARSWSGDQEEAERMARRAMEALAPGSTQWFVAVGEHSEVSGSLGHADDVEQDCRALAPYWNEPQPALIVAACRAARQLMLAGRLGAADDVLEWVGARGREFAADPTVVAWVRKMRQLKCLFQRDYEGSIEHLEASIAKFEEAGAMREACRERGNLADSYMQLGAWPQAEAALRTVLAEAEQLRLAYPTALAKSNLGFVLAQKGVQLADSAALAEGRKFSTEAVDGFVAMGNRRAAAFSRGYLAQIHLWCADLASAEHEARVAVDEATVSPPAQSHMFAVLAEVYLRLGRSSEALEAATHAKALLDRLGGIDEGEAQVRLAFAEALHAIGAADRARTEIGIARARLQEQADRIRDEAWRRTFLEAVPWHARTMAFAREWLGS